MPNRTRSTKLEDRARKIIEALGGTWSRGRGMCRCPAHDDRTPSLSITIGQRAILVHCFAGCSNAEVMQALRRIGVRISDLFHGSADPVVITKQRGDTVNYNAQRLWREAANLAGSPAAEYLKNRGLGFSSPELRFHPRMPLGPKDSARFLPAMVAAVRNDEGILALHRTFIDPVRGRLAGFDRPKRALGSLGSGAARLAFPSGGRLGLAEGIETALSAIELFGIPTWATLGNERFGIVTIPESVRELHLFVDNDAGGLLAEVRASEAYAHDGRRIVTRRPGRDEEDWNDELMRRRFAPA